MAENFKILQLKKHKILATGLFILMLFIFIATLYLTRIFHYHWLGYVNAFAEAAMVGALADWFAVTALFHHPLGLPIPHTNLIEKSKKNIGNNLGDFVVENFLTPANIRPYIEQLSIANFAANWLKNTNNKSILLKEINYLIQNILNNLDDKIVEKYIAVQGTTIIKSIELHKVVANIMQFFLDKNEHEKLITQLAHKLKTYILENEDLVKENVKKESYFFIPDFVDNKLAEKITKGLAAYFNEIETDLKHHIRHEISQQLYTLSSNLKNDEALINKLENIKNDILIQSKLDEYASTIWKFAKEKLQSELKNLNSDLQLYFEKTLENLATQLQFNEQIKNKIDNWVKYNAYHFILKNKSQVGLLISNTVGNWKGNELSQKLELEVGKDLQFIRINGTIVGGLVGLIIYSLVKFFG